MTTKLVEIKLNAKKKIDFLLKKKNRFFFFVLLVIYFEILITTFNEKLSIYCSDMFYYSIIICRTLYRNCQMSDNLVPF